MGVSPVLQGEWFKDVLYKAKEVVEMFFPRIFRNTCEEVRTFQLQVTNEVQPQRRKSFRTESVNSTLDPAIMNLES